MLNKSVLIFLGVIGIALSQDLKVSFYEHINFEGENYDVNYFSDCFPLNGSFDDKASSVNTHGNCILIYDNGNCTGRSVKLEPGTPSHDNLLNLDFNDVASSLKSCNSSDSANNYGGGGSPRDWRKSALDAHNRFRIRHGVPQLVSDDEINNSAQQCADYLAENKIFEHICSQIFGHSYGENLAKLGEGDAEKAALRATEMWYNEEYKHDYNNNNFQYSSGHFTQVVWKNTGRLGLGFAANGDFRVVVGHYDPHGNYQGQFLQNVQRPVAN